MNRIPTTPATTKPFQVLRTFSGDTLRQVYVQLGLVMLLVGLCIWAFYSLWHLLQLSTLQSQRLQALTQELVVAKKTYVKARERFTYAFDPQQIEPMLKKSYGWTDPEDIQIRFVGADKLTEIAQLEKRAISVR
ncbi:MAG: hypothetical protein WCA07_14190 [Gloeobacterales cyanobacterium]